MESCPACPDHHLIMSRVAQGPTLKFVCPKCKHETPATPTQHLVFQRDLGGASMEELHGEYLSRAAFDPTANRVNVPCPKCGRTYMTQIILGDAMETYRTCVCDYVPPPTSS